MKHYMKKKDLEKIYRRNQNLDHEMSKRTISEVVRPHLL